MAEELDREHAVWVGNLAFGTPESSLRFALLSLAGPVPVKCIVRHRGSARQV